MKMASKAQEYTEIGDIKSDLEELKSDVAALTRHVRRDGNGQLDRLGQRARDEIENLKQAGQKELRRELQIMENRIKDKPGSCMAIAFSAGLAASYLLGRRS
jgi:ElaB/YqjD/DUF883 family membrane-anchored ribosome-binding protein